MKGVMSLPKKAARMPFRVFHHLARRAGYRRPIQGYQDERFPEDQYELIRPTPVYRNSLNSLEIGCNQGKLTRMFADDGLFAVGLDLFDYHWMFAENGNAVLGAYTVTADSIDRVPMFDMVCLLSVHHQWVKANGDDHAKVLVSRVYGKARHGMFMEFAARALKYGYTPGERFADNDEVSVRGYAVDWLSGTGVDWRPTFLVRIREHERLEPFRYLYMLTPS